MMHLTFPVAVVTAAALLMPTSNALAAQAVTTSVEDLARGSDLVVRARVAHVTSRWSEDGRRIFTYAEVEPSSAWRGAAPARVTVLVPGGAVGRIGQQVSGAPTFSAGEEVVVFLHRAEAGAYRVTGLAQGKFALDGGLARPDLLDPHRLPALLRSGERRAEEMPIAELERRVRSVQ